MANRYVPYASFGEAAQRLSVEIRHPSARLVSNFESLRAEAIVALPPKFWRQNLPPMPNLLINKEDPIILVLLQFFSFSLSLSRSLSLAVIMVVALGPGRFYGSGLPRPRFYTDVKLNKDRVDPPAPVMDPLLSWANEAHWSMGGLSFKRHRLQGRIEGSIKKLRAQQERIKRNSPSLAPKPAAKPRLSGHKPQSLALLDSDSSKSVEEEEEDEEARKNAKNVGVVSSSPIGSVQRRKRVRRLGDEFDRIAEEQQMGKKGEAMERIALKTRSRKQDVERVELNEEPAVAEKASEERRKRVEAGGTVPRTSPRKKAGGTVPRRTSPRKKQLI